MCISLGCLSKQEGGPAAQRVMVPEHQRCRMCLGVGGKTWAGSGAHRACRLLQLSWATHYKVLAIRVPWASVLPSPPLFSCTNTARGARNQTTPTQPAKAKKATFSSFPLGFYLLMTKPKLFSLRYEIRPTLQKGFLNTNTESKKLPPTSQALCSLCCRNRGEKSLMLQELSS